MSDADLVTTVYEQTRGLHSAYCDLEAAGRAAPSPRSNVDTIRAARQTVERLRHALVACITPRLDALAVQHLASAPGEWGATFIGELTCRDNEDRIIGLLNSRSARLHPLALLFRNNLTLPIAEVVRRAGPRPLNLEECRQIMESDEVQDAVFVRQLRKREQSKSNTPPPPPKPSEETGGSGNRKLKPCRKKAYSQFKHAMEKKPELQDDRAVYDWLIDEDADAEDEFPAYGTWVRYLRGARNYLSASKNTSRKSKRSSGKSVVRSDQV